jgi:hypothetical protein
MQNKSYHRKTSGPPPKSGPNPQGLNISYNTVKTINNTEKINGRQLRQHRQGSTKRAKKRI